MILLNVFVSIFGFSSALAFELPKERSLQPTGVALYTPQEAVSDALSAPLEFVGTYVPNFSEGGLPSGVFRNEKVVINTDYCLPGKIPAAHIRMHSATIKRGFVRLYAEIDAGTDISDVKRTDYYDISWSMGAGPNYKGFSFDTTAAKYKAYVEQEIKKRSACVTGMSTKVSCLPGFEDQVETWGSASYGFWKSPNSDWYKLLKELRSLCVNLASETAPQP